MLAYEAKSIANKVQAIIQDNSLNRRKITKVILLFYNFTVLLLAVFIAAINNFETTPLIILGSLLIVNGLFSLLLFHIILRYYISERITYEHLNPLLVGQYNMDEGTYIKHHHDVKQHYKKLMNETGLFTRGGTFTAKEVITGKISDLYPFEIIRGHYDIYTGNSTARIFNGNIYKIHIKQPLITQFKNKGKPHLKGIRFDKYSQDQLNIYVEEGEKLPPFTQDVITFMQDFLAVSNSKNIIFSTTSDALYFAYDGPSVLKKIKQIDDTIVTKRYEHLAREIALVKTLKSLVKEIK